MNKNVNASNFKILDVEQKKNGSIIIQSESSEERERIKEAIQNNMSDTYEVKVPNQTGMKFKIMGMTFKLTENEVVEKLKKQNDFLLNSELQILKLFEYKRNGRKIYNAIIKIDNQSYAKVLDAEKVNIGWEKCRVYDGTDVIQCFKCKGYNHKAAECRNREICYKCHGNHPSKECDKEPIMKCVNCVNMNKKFNAGINEEHITTSRECPVFQNKLKAKRRRIGLMD